MYLSSMLGIGTPSDVSPDIGVGVDGMGRLFMTGSEGSRMSPGCMDRWISRWMG